MTSRIRPEAAFEQTSPDPDLRGLALSGECVTLRAVLTRRTHELTIADLEDADAWSPGWRSLR